MPPLPHSIELHDSRLEDIEIREGTAFLKLRPAYVHRDGKGWLQDADLVIANATLSTPPVALPADLDDGHLKTKAGLHHNLLKLPFHEHGPVELTLAFFSDHVLVMAGQSAAIVLHGEASYLEDVPGPLN